MLEFTMKGETTEHPIEWLRKTIDELIRKDEFERKQRQDFFSRILEEASKRLEAPLEVMEFKKVAAPRKSAQPRLVGLPAKRISEIINAYVIENRVHWREKTREENQFLLNLIVSVLGDRKIGSLTLEDMRIYKEAVLSIPKHRSKLPKYRNLSVKELLAMEIPEDERLSARNALKYLSRARTFFTWGRLNGYVKEDIGIVLTYKLPEREKKKRVPFSHTDLRKLIQSEEYKHGLHKEAHHFWLPLLGMFTGARLNELCQLHVNDIRRIRNIWVISIREGGDRKLKNKQSERDVPIHSKLLDLGFVEYVKSQKAQEQERVFPKLRKGRDGFQAAASKWFHEYCERCGVGVLDQDREIKGFHSFRHTVATVLANSKAENMYERVINQILGHEKGKSETMTTYTHAINIRTLQSAIEEIKYHIDFSHLKSR